MPSSGLTTRSAFEADNPSHKMGNEHLEEHWFPVQHANDSRAGLIHWRSKSRPDGTVAEEELESVLHGQYPRSDAAQTGVLASAMAIVKQKFRGTAVRSGQRDFRLDERSS